MKIAGTGSADWNAFFADLGAAIRQQRQPYRRAYDDPARLNELVEQVVREFQLNSPHNR